MINLDAAKSRYINATKEERRELLLALDKALDVYAADPKFENAIAAISAFVDTHYDIPGANGFWKDILLVALNGYEERLKKAEALPDSIQWALNSGDGTYRP